MGSFTPVRQFYKSVRKWAFLVRERYFKNLSEPDKPIEQHSSHKPFTWYENRQCEHRHRSLTYMEYYQSLAQQLCTQTDVALHNGDNAFGSAL
jgi:hypothetical protein